MAAASREQIEALTGKNTAAGCSAMKALLALSEESGCVYPYMEQFIHMMDSENSYIRTRGLLLICANAKWDADHRIDENLPQILNHITDEKPITARQFIGALAQIAAAKPDLKKEILAALRMADPRKYPLSMRGLVETDLRRAICQVEQG